MNTLPDYLKNNLDIVLVGLNPSQVSVERGHYFANPLRYSRGGGIHPHIPRVEPAPVKTGIQPFIPAPPSCHSERSAAEPKNHADKGQVDSTEQTESMNTLPDYLKNNLDIVLVGLNPSQVSVERGHYFANPLRYSRGGGNPSPHPPRRACPREDGGFNHSSQRPPSCHSERSGAEPKNLADKGQVDGTERTKPMKTLPDYLKNNLDVVLVGLNPSQVSVERRPLLRQPPKPLLAAPSTSPASSKSPCQWKTTIGSPTTA